ncbi:MAG TPA: EVE domain-containing protein [Gemmataceae bacterium]|jgi:predicted RNA-binding protein with PUA-like domain|nr:EVE domain-containing protein [Gemmataceae bacterium]HEV3444442.1 EVE domain-containing protein [Gemmataceae bacterium]
MAYWLFKEEPTHYNYADLERDGKTLWSGVNNPLARKYLRQVRSGDRILYYHTGKEKAIVGEMRAVGDSRQDKDNDDNAVVVEVQAVKRLKNPVSLARVKRDSQLKDWDLARLPRLSVMPVTEDQWRRVEELSKEAENSP